MIEFSFFANSWQFRFGIYFTSLSEAVSQKCSGKKVFWKISRDSLENACFGIWRPAIDWKRDSSIVVFCRFCKVFNNTFFTEHLRVTSSDFTPLCSTSWNGRKASNKMLRAWICGDIGLLDGWVKFRQHEVKSRIKQFIDIFLEWLLWNTNMMEPFLWNTYVMEPFFS